MSNEIEIVDKLVHLDLTLNLHSVHSDFTNNDYDIESHSFRTKISKGGPLSNRETPTSTSGVGSPVLCFCGGRLLHRSLDVQL